MRASDELFTKHAALRQMFTSCKAFMRRFQPDAEHLQILLRNAGQTLESSLTSNIIIPTLFDPEALPTKNNGGINADKITANLHANLNSKYHAILELRNDKKKLQTKLIQICGQLGLYVNLQHGETINEEALLDQWSHLIETATNRATQPGALRELAEKYQALGVAKPPIDQNQTSSYPQKLQQQTHQTYRLFKAVNAYLLQNIRQSPSLVAKFNENHKQWQEKRLELARYPHADFTFLLDHLQRPYPEMLAEKQRLLTRADNADAEALGLAKILLPENKKKYFLGEAMQRLLTLIKRREKIERTLLCSLMGHFSCITGSYQEINPDTSRDPWSPENTDIIRCEIAYSIVVATGADSPQLQQLNKLKTDYNDNTLIRYAAASIYRSQSAEETIVQLFSQIPDTAQEEAWRLLALTDQIRQPNVPTSSLTRWLMQQSRNINETLTEAFSELARGECCQQNLTAIENYCARLENLDTNLPDVQELVNVQRLSLETDAHAKTLIKSTQPVAVGTTHPLLPGQDPRIIEHAKTFINDFLFELYMLIAALNQEMFVQMLPTTIVGCIDMYKRYLNYNPVEIQLKQIALYQEATHCRQKVALLFPDNTTLLHAIYQPSDASGAFVPLFSTFWCQTLLEQFKSAATRLTSAFLKENTAYHYTQQILHLCADTDALIKNRQQLTKQCLKETLSPEEDERVLLDCQQYLQGLTRLIEQHRTCIDTAKNLSFKDKKEGRQLITVLRKSGVALHEEIDLLKRHYNNLFNALEDIQTDHAAAAPRNFFAK